MPLDWSLACTSCREFTSLGAMQPWKWSGFQVDFDVVREWLSLHARDACALCVDVSGSSADRGCTLSVSDGWREDLRSRGLWAGVSTRSVPARARCAACDRWLAVLPEHGDPELLRGVASPVVIGSYLWLCDDRCLARFTSAPGRVYRAAPARPEGATKLTCGPCASERVVDPADPLALAVWLTEHVGPGCALRARSIETPDRGPDPGRAYRP
jgi:hypothetical protein